GRAGLAELRMKRKALEAALASHGLHADAPRRRVDVEIQRHHLAVVAHAVERPAHVVDEQALRSRLVHQVHHSRGDTLDVGYRRKLADADPDHTLSRGDRCGKRVCRLSWREWRGLRLLGGDGWRR